jgi:hypothetical protein
MKRMARQFTEQFKKDALEILKKAIGILSD